MKGRGRATLAAVRLCVTPLLVCVTIPAAACNREASSASGATDARSIVTISPADSELHADMADASTWPSFGRDYSPRGDALLVFKLGATPIPRAGK